MISLLKWFLFEPYWNPVLDFCISSSKRAVEFYNVGQSAAELDNDKAAEFYSSAEFNNAGIVEFNYSAVVFHN